MLFGAMNFPILSVVDEIYTIGDMGFDYAELAMDPPLAHYSVIRKQEKEIRKALDSSQLGVVCHMPTFLSTADLAKAVREAAVNEILYSLQTAADLGAKKIVLHPSSAVGMGNFVIEEVKRYANEFFEKINIAAEHYSLTVCLENMFPRNGIGVEVEDFEKFFAMFPQFRMTLDTGHANIGDIHENRLVRLVEKFGTKISHLHCSDNRGQRDDHIAVGDGTVDFENCISKLKDAGYNSTITLEIFENDPKKILESREKIQLFFRSA